MMASLSKTMWALILAAMAATTSAYSHSLTGVSDISFTDIDTGIGDVKTLFTEEPTQVTVSLSWDEVANNYTGPLKYYTMVDGKLQASGEVTVEGDPPSSLDAGVIEVKDRGTVKVVVEVEFDAPEKVSTSRSIQAYGNGVALIPLFVVLGFAIASRMVEFSLFSAVFVGACMVAGNIKDGFKSTLDVYILDAISDVGHAYVFLFTLFLSGLVSMMQRSGGMQGFTQDVSRFAKTPRSGQFAAFFIGCVVFFDDYANTLLAGQSMRALLDTLHVSREKLAFVVDATAAPIASISPISSWVGFEVGLIQDEIDKIVEREGTEDIGIETSGYAVFLESLKYRYYPIFMLILMVMLIGSKREFGTMLIAERKTQVYKRTDGGEGRGEAGEMEVSPHITPRRGTPRHSFNMIVPICLLVFFIFYLLVQTGEIEGEDQDFMDKIEASDSYAALLWGTMASMICTMLFYLLQFVKDGKSVWPTWQMVKDFAFNTKPENLEADHHPRSLMNLQENLDSFLHGMGKIFPALIVLTLAWAVGSMMTDVGADRLFARWIVDGIQAEMLPTLSFVISFFMALATGTSWGTMTILFPLVLVPTYDASGGDPTIFYSTTAGILSGSVAGDHVSPISDTTVLSSLACDCKLLAHVATQFGYVMVVVIISILFGTIPIGKDAWPNVIGFLLGTLVLVGFIYGICVPVISPTGRYDIITELVIRFRQRQGRDAELAQIKADTVLAYEGKEVAQLKKTYPDGEEVESDNDAKEAYDPDALEKPEPEVLEADEAGEVAAEDEPMKTESPEVAQKEKMQMGIGAMFG